MLEKTAYIKGSDSNMSSNWLKRSEGLGSQDDSFVLMVCINREGERKEEIINSGT